MNRRIFIIISMLMGFASILGLNINFNFYEIVGRIIKRELSYLIISETTLNTFLADLESIGVGTTLGFNKEKQYFTTIYFVLESFRNMLFTLL